MCCFPEIYGVLWMITRARLLHWSGCNKWVSRGTVLYRGKLQPCAPAWTYQRWLALCVSARLSAWLQHLSLRREELNTSAGPRKKKNTWTQTETSVWSWGVTGRQNLLPLRSPDGGEQLSPRSHAEQAVFFLYLHLRQKLFPWIWELILTKITWC